MKKSQIFILTLGVFSIINTEMGVVGILPMIAQQFGVTITTAGLLVSLFAMVVAISGPTMPLLFSGVNRKHLMVLVLSTFTICNLISAFTTNFTVLLVARVIPAFFHPVYVSLAFSVAGSSVSKEEAPKAVSKVMMGVSAGMVLGVPVISYIASLTSLRVGMLMFALVNAVVLLATIVIMPSLEVTERMSYGSQLRILKEPMIWLSFGGVMLLNGSLFGVYSYVSEYLEKVTHASQSYISVLLFVYGMANILGNIVGGRGLSSMPKRFVSLFAIPLFGVYVLLLILGSYSLPVAGILLVWGVLAGAAGNINQYWMTSAAPNAPDFANGLFLASTNLGTMLGTFLCGEVIRVLGISNVVVGGMGFLMGAAVLLNLRLVKYKH